MATLSVKEEQIFRNIKSMIEEVGGTMTQIVKLTNYFINMSNLQTFIKVRNKYFNTKEPPTSTSLQVSKLFMEDLLLEVQGIVIIPKNK